MEQSSADEQPLHEALEAAVPDNEIARLAQVDALLRVVAAGDWALFVLSTAADGSREAG